MPHCRNNSKKFFFKNTTLSEQFWNQIKKYHTVGTILKSNKKIPHCQNNSKIKYWQLNIQIHDRSLFWFGTETSIKSSVVKLILWSKTSPLSEMTWTCKCFSPLCNRSTPICNRAISVIERILKGTKKKRQTQNHGPQNTTE
jgi:hypothetical protein